MGSSNPSVISINILLVLFYILPQVTASNGHIAKKLAMHSADFENLATTSLLELHETGFLATPEINSDLIGATYLDRKDPEHGRKLAQESPEFMRFSIPQQHGANMILQLFRAQVYASDAKVCRSSSPDSCMDATQGLHYWGIVEGHPQDSIASISISEGEIAGVIQLENHQYVLGNMEGSDMEVFYRDDQLQALPNFSHDSVFSPEFYPAFGVNSDNSDGTDSNCVQIYVESTYDIFQHHQTFDATKAWIEAVFAQVFVLYDNDGLLVTLKTLYIWDTPDSYSSGAGGKLNEFRDRLNGIYDGDLAQLISYQGGGGVAYLNTLCNKKFGVSYSGLSRSYNDVPTYSWTVMVIAHELGHNLGSHHTHNCVWGDGDDAVDCCGTQAGYDACGGNCNANPYLPVNGGTIMSYCHLIGGVGINFNEGFGPEPLAKITAQINSATCLSTCNSCPTYCADMDNDTFGDPNNCVQDCNGQPTDYVDNDDDCDDTTDTITTGSKYYPDQDQDGFGDFTRPLIACEKPAEYVTDDQDCNDKDNSINPNGYEVCDGQDNDCNGIVDDVSDDTTKIKFYRDADGDGYGDPNVTELACAPSAGYVSNDNDCDDTNPELYIGARCMVSIANEQRCEGSINSSCSCEAKDSDNDGVCDTFDKCSDFDDNLDADNNGIADCEERVCVSQKDKFKPKKLFTNKEPPKNSMTKTFDAPVNDLKFTVFDIGSRKNKYDEKVTVTYTGVDGEQRLFGSMTGDELKEINKGLSKKDRNDWIVEFEMKNVTSITVVLEDTLASQSSATAKVKLGDLSYCVWEYPNGGS